MRVRQQLGDGASRATTRAAPPRAGSLRQLAPDDLRHARRAHHAERVRPSQPLRVHHVAALHARRRPVCGQCGEAGQRLDVARLAWGDARAAIAARRRSGVRVLHVIQRGVGCFARTESSLACSQCHQSSKTIIRAEPQLESGRLPYRRQPWRLLGIYGWRCPPAHRPPPRYICAPLAPMVRTCCRNPPGPPFTSTPTHRRTVVRDTFVTICGVGTTRETTRGVPSRPERKTAPSPKSTKRRGPGSSAMSGCRSTHRCTPGCAVTVGTLSFRRAKPLARVKPMNRRSSCVWRPVVPGAARE